MQYLVQMKLAASNRPKTRQEGVAFVEGYILPSLEMCKKLEAEKKILAGGPVGGAIALAFVIKTETIQELDELLESLPLWPLMETTVTPLTSIEGRITAIRRKAEYLRGQFQTR